MQMKRILFFAVVMAGLHLLCRDGLGSETYFIDHQRVLLYKIINAWYDSPPEESERLCGLPIQYHNQGNVRVEYNGLEEQALHLQINEDPADLLSVLKPCQRCFGPAFFQCTWLNKKYFGKGEAVVLSNDPKTISVFRFHLVGEKQARHLQRIEKDIALVIEGVVRGLLNGKIALHRSGTLIRECPGGSSPGEENTSIVLKIVNFRTKEVMARYIAVFQP